MKGCVFVVMLYRQLAEYSAILMNIDFFIANENDVF